MMKIELSVIIPVYNVREYLKQCVESAIGLECAKEILLIDDGSNDGSELICDEFSEKYKEIKVYHKENSGLSSARNFGISNSKGEYILFLDSDDFLDVKETNEIIKYTKSGKDIIMGLYNNYYDFKKIIPESCGIFSNQPKVYDIESVVKNIPADGKTCILTAWRFVVKTEFIKKNGLFFKEGIYHEDEEWAFKMLMKVNSVYVVNNYFYNYRRNREGSIVSKPKAEYILDRMIIINEMINNKNVNTDVKKKFMIERIGQLYLCNLFDLHLIKNCEYEHRVIDEMRKTKGFFYKYEGDKNFKLAVLKIMLLIVGIKSTANILAITRKN